jgi:TonB family protein
LKWPSGPVAFVRSELVDPLPSQNLMDNSSPQIIEKTFGATKLTCVYMAPKIPPRGDVSRLLFPSYCFSPAKPVLRSATTFSNFNEILFNRIVLFRGGYLGGDIDVTRMGKDYAKIHLESAEPLRSPDQFDFTPPADAVAPKARKISVSAGVAQGNLLSKIEPKYPSDAKAKHVQGTVVLQATIDKSGHISNLQPVSGPSELQPAAIDAVRQWVYKPYLLNGEVVEVQTTINVVFSFW